VIRGEPRRYLLCLPALALWERRTPANGGRQHPHLPLSARTADWSGRQLLLIVDTSPLARMASRKQRKIGQGSVGQPCPATVRFARVPHLVAEEKRASNEWITARPKWREVGDDLILQEIRSMHSRVKRPIDLGFCSPKLVAHG
jgi:hypothetical protein